MLFKSVQHFPKPVSYDCALKELRRALENSGIPARDFTLHSGRRGGSTEAAKNGIDLASLQRQGRWVTSVMPHAYIEEAMLNQQNFTVFLGL